MSTQKSQHCDQCPQSFSRAGHHKRHRVAHSVEKFHPCNQCVQSFRWAENLKGHMFLHNVRGSANVSHSALNANFSTFDPCIDSKIQRGYPWSQMASVFPPPPQPVPRSWCMVHVLMVNQIGTGSEKLPTFLTFITPYPNMSCHMFLHFLATL